ncbi:MAG: hypothetical protein V7L05_14660 [Nostoc sp.]|uniref:hypothetical protein n=1 Tax=Nostoc sp. TaxID=1180 RepID=UPI002FFB2399
MSQSNKGDRYNGLLLLNFTHNPWRRSHQRSTSSKVFWEGIWSAAKVEALWAVVGIALAPFTFGVSLAATVYGTIQEWNESQKRVLVLGEALIQWIK